MTAGQLGSWRQALGLHRGHLLATLGYAALATTCAAVATQLIGPAATATAAMAIAVFTLVVVLQAVITMRLLPVAQRTPTAESVGEAAVADATETAEAIGAEILSAIEQGRAEVLSERVTAPTIPDEAPAGEEVPGVGAGQWVPLSMAARMTGQDKQVLYRATRAGELRRRRAREGGWLVDLDEVQRFEGYADEPTDTTATSTHHSEMAQVQHRIAEAIAAGRAGLQLTTVAMLPSRKPGVIDSRLVLTDAAGQSIDTPVSIGDDVRLQLDLIAIAFAGATLRQLPRTASGRPMFVHVAASSIADAGFQAELEAAFDEDADLPAKLIFMLPLGALAELSADGSLDWLRARGLRLAADAHNMPMNVVRRTFVPGAPMSFIRLSADALLNAPDDVAAIAGLSIAPMAADVTTEKQVVELLDLGIEFAEGALFPAPKCAPVRLPTPALAA